MDGLGPTTLHFAAGSENNVDIGLVLLGRQPTRERRIRNHVVEQPLGIAIADEAGCVDLKVKASLRTVGLHMEARHLQIVAQRSSVHVALYPRIESLAI